MADLPINTLIYGSQVRPAVGPVVQPQYAAVPMPDPRRQAQPIAAPSNAVATATDTGGNGFFDNLTAGFSDPLTLMGMQMFGNGGMSVGAPRPMFQGVPQVLEAAQGMKLREEQAQQKRAEQEAEAERKRLLAETIIPQLPANLQALAQVDPEGALAIYQQMQPKSQSLINAGDGRLYDPNSGEWIVAPDSDAGMTDTQQNLLWRAKQAGLVEGSPEWQQFMVTGGQGGTSLSVGPDGSVSFQQGGAAKPLTEGQSKDTVYATRANAALPKLEAYEQSLLSLGESVAGNVPVLGNFMQSEEYQLGRDAGLDFLIAVLRKDTGAAVTPSEEQFYGRIFLPQPGDKPSVVEAKRHRRAMAVAAIEAGMPPQALENMARALATDGSSGATPPPSPTQGGTNTGTTSSGLTWTVK
jgi:hypothetical protein